TPKKVSPVEKYIFQRHTPAPTEPSGHAESLSIYAELGLTESDTKSNEEVSHVVKIGAQDEGQAGPNPGVQIKGQPRSNPGDDAEPASSTGTLSSLQHLAKDFSFGDQFFNDNPSEAENEKITTETESESMVSVTIHQDTSTNPPMTSPKSMNYDHTDELLTDLVEARRKKKKIHDSLKTPPGSPPPPPPPPDIENAHIPKVNLQQDWWKPLKEDRPTTPDPAWYNVCKPLPLGGPPGQVTIQSDFFFNKYLEYLRYGNKGGRPALSISKIKAAYYPDVGLEQMVPNQMWIKEECKYDIAAMYGISQLWFQRQRFYIDRHTSEGDRRAVRTYMRILSVVRIEVFSMYGYDYMKKIVLRRADLNKHIIAKRDFKYLYPGDFEDLYLLNLQGHLNHLPPKDRIFLLSGERM
nr:hypothetical protein [Tanacetum cinerariifolium]